MQNPSKSGQADIAAPDAPSQFTPEFLAATRELENQWRESFDKMARKFGVDPQDVRRTNSGLPLKPAYFPHDIADFSSDILTAPGSFPFTRGLNAAQYQFMTWANQPVIGCGLPEETRARMDYLESMGMTGYFGNTFYN